MLSTAFGLVAICFVMCAFALILVGWCIWHIALLEDKVERLEEELENLTITDEEFAEFLAENPEFEDLA